MLIFVEFGIGFGVRFAPKQRKGNTKLLSTPYTRVIAKIKTRDYDVFHQTRCPYHQSECFSKFKIVAPDQLSEITLIRRLFSVSGISG